MKLCKPPRIFYGWWIVAASFIIAMYGGGAVYYGFTAIFEPIANEFNWSYTQMSIAASLRGVEMGLLAPITGLFVDRWGPRRIIFSGAIITAAGLIMLSYTSSLFMFYGAFILIAFGISCCATTVLMAAVNNWFDHKFGFAGGIVLSGYGFGGLLIPVIVKLIDAFEWRVTMVILALLMLAIVLPLSLLFRHKPEQYGYSLDGKDKNSEIDDISSEFPTHIEPDVRLKKVIMSIGFWQIVLAFTCFATVLSAVVTHIMPYLSSIGVDRSTSGLVAGVLPIISIFGRLGFGWLGDKIGWIRTSILAFTMMSLGIFSFGYIPITGTWFLAIFLICFGIGYGASLIIRSSLIRESFGRNRFGTISGLIIGLTMIGAVTGPALAGWVFDAYADYTPIWFTFAAVLLLALVLITTIRRFHMNKTMS